MKLLAVEYGIHTIELYASAVPYEQSQQIIEALLARNAFYKMRETEQLYEDRYGVDRTYRSDIFSSSGIRFYIEQKFESFCGIRFVVNPSTLCSGTHCGLALYQPKNGAHVLDCLKWFLCGRMFSLHMEDLFHLDPQKLSLSRIDFTVNLHFPKGTDLTEMIRLFRQGKTPDPFHRDTLNKSVDQRHILRVRAKKIQFTAYDKLYDLERKGMIETPADSEVLRLELTLGRKAYRKKLHLTGDETFDEVICLAYQNVIPLVRKFLRRIFPNSGEHLPYQKAQKAIMKQIHDPLLREQMLFLLERISRNTFREAAEEAFHSRYRDPSYHPLEAVYVAFDQINVNPATFVKDSKCGALESFRTLV